MTSETKAIRLNSVTHGEGMYYAKGELSANQENNDL